MITRDHNIQDDNKFTNLIAAAPELLECLERILHNYVDANDQADPDVIEAYEAIRRAKGEL